jgi:hypothetical protein
LQHLTQRNTAIFGTPTYGWQLMIECYTDYPRL